jgi:hypothetical protein
MVRVIILLLAILVVFIDRSFIFLSNKIEISSNYSKKDPVILYLKYFQIRLSYGQISL